jgi:hypothetical protein
MPSGKEITMKAIKFPEILAVLFFLASPSLAQTVQVETPASSVTEATAQSPELLARKTAAAQEYLKKKTFGIIISGVYMNQRFSNKVDMYPLEQYTLYLGRDICFHGKMETAFSVDVTTGELVAKLRPRVSFCDGEEYHFDVITRKGYRILIDSTGKVRPSDTSFVYSLE